MRDVQAAAHAVVGELSKVVYGKRPKIEQVVCCLLARGHVLLEDVPGTAKTLLAKALARALGGRFRRLQCTPDLLPGDVTGTNVFNQKTQEFQFHPGPVFTQILVADEINRATPRAQAALLECMAEGQVSIETKTYRLPEPFFVLATQNPIEHEGTFALPEAQLDRFLMRLSIGYPSLDAEVEMLVCSEREDPLERIEPILSAERLLALQRRVREVHVHDQVRRYVVQLVAATRSSKHFALGAGPRATQSLYRASQALAAMAGREFVLPDDVKRLVPSILHHRVILGPEGRLGRRTVAQAVDAAIGLVPAPSMDPSVLAVEHGLG